MNERPKLAAAKGTLNGGIWVVRAGKRIGRSRPNC